MHGHLGPTAINQAIAALAARQYGVITRAQLMELGLERGAIDHRLATRRLHRLHAGVYAVGHRSPRREARWLAAVLACGKDAMLSHRSAASLWAIREGEGPRPDVTIPGRSGRQHPDIAIHRPRVTPPDVCVRAGIPVTSPRGRSPTSPARSSTTSSCVPCAKRSSCACSTWRRCRRC